MFNILLDLEVDRVDLVDEGANSQAFIKLYKRKETDKDMDFAQILAKLKPEHAAIVKDELAKAKAEVPEEVQKRLTELENDKQALSTELAKAKEDLQAHVAKGKSETDALEEVLKSADPIVQEVVKSLKARTEAAEAATRELINKAKQEEAIAKAKELKALPVEEDKLVEVLKSVTPEVYEILKSAAKAVEEASIFQEVGKSKGSEGGSDAWARIEKKASEIQKRDGITFEAAVSKAITENKELYREYLEHLEGGAN